MKTPLSIILILTSFLTFGQSAFQIADTTKKWNTLYYGSGPWCVVQCGGMRVHRIAEEVLLNDTVFHKVYESQDSLQQEWEEIGYIREDTVTQKIYFSEYGQTGLIYDFNITVGDSVLVDNYYIDSEDILLICDSINSVIINGVSRNQFFFSTPLIGGISDTWIEGIGSKRGLLNSGKGGVGFAGGDMALLCCSKSDTVIYMDTFYNSCYIQEFYPILVSEYYDTAYLDESYEFQLQLSGTNNVDSFALIGDLIPEGFEFDVTTGLLTGFPTSTGSFPCVITVKNCDLGLLTGILYSDITVVVPATAKDIKEQPKIEIYPNPFNSVFSISYDGSPGNSYCLEIFNCQGRMIDKKIITETDCRMDLSNYERGIYLLKITDMNQKILKVEKMIKE